MSVCCQELLTWLDDVEAGDDHPADLVCSRLGSDEDTTARNVQQIEKFYQDYHAFRKKERTLAKDCARALFAKAFKLDSEILACAQAATLA